MFAVQWKNEVTTHHSTERSTANMSKKIIQLNKEIIKGALKELVRSSVEKTLNNLLDQEAKDLTQAAKYERTEVRQGYRAGHYDRNLTTTSGNVTLKVPKLKGIPFETAIIERYRRRESSVEEALIEMYLAGVSVRQVEDITKALGDTGTGSLSHLKTILLNCLYFIDILDKREDAPEFNTNFGASFIILHSDAPHHLPLLLRPSPVHHV
jgi:hypothetical protein